MLSYLFYVGIVLPTVVTLALFVFFVICWRRQSARKAVLTKPYDPHGTMRRLGISNRPPPPPVYARTTLLPFPSELEDEGGEDNAAYDMSRSPSAEAHGAGNLAGGGPRPLQFHAGGVVLGDVEHHYHEADHQHQHQHLQVLLQGSPCRELDVSGRLAFHNRLDSGLSEPACHSPVSGGGGGGVASAGAEGGGGGAGGERAGGGAASSSSRERPQSQNSHTSHSSHSTDSEDSGFRSSRSGGQLAQTGAGQDRGQGCPQQQQQQHESPAPVVMKRSRSGDRGQGRGLDHVHYRVGGGAGGCCQDGEAGDPPIQLTPTALWPHHPHIHDHHHYNHHHPHHSPHHYPPPALDGAGVKSTRVDLADIRAQLDWKYLQHLAYHPPGGSPSATKGGGGPRSPTTSPTTLTHSHRPPVTCHQRLTLAHVHSSCDTQDSPAEVLSFSVV